MFFENHYYLFFLLLFVVLVIFLYKKWTKKIFFNHFEDLLSVYKSNCFYYFFYFVLIFFVFVLYTIIFSNLYIKDTIEKVNKNWIDIEIVIDVSYSMDASDLKPSRIEVSKLVIKDFLSKLSWDRVWVIVFAWQPFSSVPLSFDYDFLNRYISNISSNLFDQTNIDLQWTSTWDAILLAIDSLLSDKKNLDREKIIILISDWEANKWIDPKLASKLAKEKNIKIYTIWVWWKEKTYIDFYHPIFWTQKIEIPWLDEEKLKYISESTMWKFFRVEDKGSFEEVFREISKLEKKDIESQIFTHNKELNIYIVYLLIALFFYILFIKYRKNI